MDSVNWVIQFFFFFFFFSIRGFFHGHWQLTGQQGKGGDLFLFHSTTSTRSRTFRHLCATLHVKWLSHIFNRNACFYQTATRWGYYNEEWLGESLDSTVSSNINEGIKAVLFFKWKKWVGPNKLVKVCMYVGTFTNLLGPSEYANLLVPQK